MFSNAPVTVRARACVN